MKPGDVVKIIKNPNLSPFIFIGKVGTVYRVRNDMKYPIYVKFNDGYDSGFSEDELEVQA
jgi:hypothetical protein